MPSSFLGLCFQSLLAILSWPAIVKVVGNWTKDNALEVSAAKDELVLLTRSYKFPEFRLQKLEVITTFPFP